MSAQLSADEMAVALEKIVRNQLRIKELSEENDNLKAFLKQEETGLPLGRHEFGKFYVTVTENKRINDALAKKVLRVTDYNRYSKKVIDPALAKKALDADVLAKITTVYDNKIEVGLR